VLYGLCVDEAEDVDEDFDTHCNTGGQEKGGCARNPL
jgi:hypothetical protein